MTKKPAKKVKKAKSASPAKNKKQKQKQTRTGFRTMLLVNDDQIYTQLKICLSRITHFAINEIATTDSMSGKFHFTPGGLRVLAQNLEACFAQAGCPIPKKLNRDKMEAAATVGAVAIVINTAFGV